MTEISATGERFQEHDPGRRSGLPATQTLVIALATIVLSVIATSVAVGAFLWLATEARIEATDARIESVENQVERLDNRMMRLEERMTALEVEVKGINERLKAVEEGLRRIENILLYRQGAAPAAPGAGAP